MSIAQPYGPFAHLYRQFFENRHNHKGYNFGEAPPVKNAPASMPFPRPLTWWSTDRPQRLRAHRAERDRRLQEIVELGKKSKTSPSSKKLPSVVYTSAA